MIQRQPRIEADMHDCALPVLCKHCELDRVP